LSIEILLFPRIALWFWDPHSGCLLPSPPPCPLASVGPALRCPSAHAPEGRTDITPFLSQIHLESHSGVHTGWTMEEDAWSQEDMEPQAFI
jgi:hypothetical protein